MKLIPIYSHRVVATHALVDDEDYATLAAFHWSLDQDGYARRSWRRQGKTYSERMHRRLLGLTTGSVLVGDHRNGNRLDNQRRNLRAVTVMENAQRRAPRKVGTSRFRGVHRLRSSGKWQASVRYRDRMFHLGTWDTEEEAADIAARVRGALMAYSEEASPCVT